MFRQRPGRRGPSGNAGRGTVRGPGYSNMDITLSKNFNLNGDGRWKLQIRGESFNTFNLVNPNGFSSPITPALRSA